MATKKEIEIAFKGKDEGASTVVERLAQRLKLMKKESRLAGEGVLERTLSSGRGLSGAALDAAGLGIQSIVVEAIGGAIDRVSGKALELREQFKQGKIDAGDMAVEIAKSVPLLGPFVSGFLNVRELITGEKAEIAEINRETEATNKLLDKQAEFAKRVKQEHEGSLEAIRQMQNEGRLIGTADPLRGMEQIRQKRENAEAAINKKYDAAKPNTLYDDYKKEIETQKNTDEARYQELREKVEQQKRLDQKYGRDIYGRSQAPTVITKSEAEQLSKLAVDLNAQDQKLADLKKKQDAANAQRNADKSKEIAEAKNLEAKQYAEYEKEVAAKRAEAARQGAEEIAQIKSEARQAELSADEKFFEARMEAIRSQREKEISDTTAAAKAAIAAESDPAAQAQLLARANAKIDAIKQRAAANEYAAQQEQGRKSQNIATNALKETLAAESDLEQQDLEEKIARQRDIISAAGQRRAKVSATLVNDRFTDQAGQEQDRQEARAQKTREEQAATLKKMLDALNELKKQRGRAL